MSMTQVPTVTTCPADGCAGSVMWARTRKGKRILLDAEPVPWRSRVFSFIDNETVQLADRREPGPFFACHWERCDP